MNEISSHLLGGVAALASALCWAVSAILFRRIGDRLPAAGMNLGKVLVAIVCMLLFVSMDGFAPTDERSFLFLALSGILGICLGDTLYFLALLQLGPRLTLLVGTLIPVTTAVMAVTLLGENIVIQAWLGIALTLAGVTYVLWQNAPQDSAVSNLRKGLLWGGLFVLAHAGAIIMSKVGVAEISAMQAGFIRMLWAMMGLTFWGLAVGQLVTWVRPLQDPRLLRSLLVAAVIGAFLGSWFSLLGLKYTHASVATTLNSTTPLFALLLAGLWLRERVRLQAVMGAGVAVLGVGIYFSAVN